MASAPLTATVAFILTTALIAPVMAMLRRFRLVDVIRRMGEATWFASEIRPLLSLGASTVSAESIADFLHLGAVPADRSPFTDLEVVAPNTVVTLHPDGSRSKGPVVAGPHPLAGDGALAIDPAAAFVDSVRLHLRSDVPTVLLLSAGMDSAAIACAARQSGVTLHCSTVSSGTAISRGPWAWWPPPSGSAAPSQRPPPAGVVAVQPGAGTARAEKQ